MWYTRVDDVITLSIYVQPGAKATELVGFYDGRLKIRLNSPPIEGRANEALKKFIAGLFGVPSRQVSLVSGEKARRKLFKIVGSSIDPQNLWVMK